MVKYEKVVKLLKKEFPEITQEEVDQMISQIPMHLPMPVVLLAIKATKLKMQAPEAFEKLKGKSWNTIGEEITLDVQSDDPERMNLEPSQDENE